MVRTGFQSLAWLALEYGHCSARSARPARTGLRVDVHPYSLELLRMTNPVVERFILPEGAATIAIQQSMAWRR